MTVRPDTNDYLHLFLNDVPLMDVRAPVEFEKGAFPCATNYPLMNDDERHQVGIRYKELGQEAAIRLGHELVRGEIKHDRIDQWVHFANSHPQGYLFCFRGGLRSQLTQQWIREAGIDYPRVRGGYKALRSFLIEQLDALLDTQPLYVISGRTGTGKTRLLLQTPNPVDLEGMANHRGSSFGRTLAPQPSQIDFENRLTVALLKATHRQSGPMAFEDESRLIGQCALPLRLRQRLEQAPLIVLERTLEERIQIILEDYVTDMLAAYVARDDEREGWLNFRDYLLSALDRIRKRLGGERHSRLRRIMETALDEQFRHGKVTTHADWIKVLLQDYYDPMYDFQLSKKRERIALSGNAETLRAWTRETAANRSSRLFY